MRKPPQEGQKLCPITLIGVNEYGDRHSRACAKEECQWWVEDNCVIVKAVQITANFMLLKTKYKEIPDEQ